jgi:hypothetical protein
VSAPAATWHQWLDPPLLYSDVHRSQEQDPATAAVIWPELYRTQPDALAP